jgi:hypothetical protein
VNVNPSVVEWLAGSSASPDVAVNPFQTSNFEFLSVITSVSASKMKLTAQSEGV